MKNKKIFFIANSESIHTVKWVDYFIDNGYEVYLASFSNINKTKCKNIYFLSSKKVNAFGNNYYYILKVWKLSKILKEIKPSFINAHYSYSMGFIGILAKKISKIESDFSVVCHGSDILLGPKPRFVFKKINSYVLKNSNKIFAVSDQIKDKIETFNIDNKKIFVGQYGINLNIKNYSKEIDIVSNRAYKKNSRIEFLLEALTYFKDKNLNIVFVVPNISDKEFDRIVKKYDFIKFYKYLEYNKMMEVVKKSKVYISATKSDGTSLSLLEAISFSAIPLISNIVPNRSWVLDGVNGYLFDTKKEFIEKITLALGENKDMQNINFNLLKIRGEYATQMMKIEKFLIEKID